MNDKVIVRGNKIIYSFNKAVSGGAGVFFLVESSSNEIEVVNKNQYINNIQVFELIIKKESVACFETRKQADEAKILLMHEIVKSNSSNIIEKFLLSFIFILLLIAVFVFGYANINNKNSNIFNYWGAGLEDVESTQNINSKDNKDLSSNINYSHKQLVNAVKSIPGNNQDLLDEVDKLSSDLEIWYNSLSNEEKSALSGFNGNFEKGLSQKSLQNVLSKNSVKKLTEQQNNMNVLIEKISKRVYEKQASIKAQENDVNYKNDDFGGYEDVKPKEFKKQEQNIPVTAGSSLLDKMKSSK